MIDWLIEHKTNVYALVTIEKNFNIYVVQEKSRRFPKGLGHFKRKFQAEGDIAH